LLRQKASSQIHRVSGWLAKLNPAIADAECVLDQVEYRRGNRLSAGRAGEPLAVPSVPRDWYIICV
jgi:hypothetical protein